MRKTKNQMPCPVPDPRLDTPYPGCEWLVIDVGGARWPEEDFTVARSWAIPFAHLGIDPNSLLAPQYAHEAASLVQGSLQADYHLNNCKLDVLMPDMGGGNEALIKLPEYGSVSLCVLNLIFHKGDEHKRSSLHACRIVESRLARANPWLAPGRVPSDLGKFNTEEERVRALILSAQSHIESLSIKAHLADPSPVSGRSSAPRV